MKARATIPAIAGALAICLTSAIVSAQATELDPPGSEKPERVVVPDGGEHVEMLSMGGRPGVYAKINGKGPFRFIVDTGSSVCLVIDPSIAMLTRLEEAHVENVSEEHQRLFETAYDLDELSIGDAKFEDFTALSMEIKRLFGNQPDAPDGVIGLPLFEDLLLTYDIAAGEIGIERGALDQRDPDVLPIIHDEATGVGVSVELTVGGVPARAHIDTGSPSSLMLPSAMKERVPIEGELALIGHAKSPMGTSEIWAGELVGNVVIGAHEFKLERVTFGDIGRMQAGGFGNVGSAMLADFSLTVDQRNDLVRLRRERPAGSGEVHLKKTPPPGKLGMFVRVGEDKVTIDQVTPGGYAHLSGLQTGDELVSVDGKPVAGLSARELQPLMAGDKVLLEIVRDGETRSITLRRK